MEKISAMNLNGGYEWSITKKIHPSKQAFSASNKPKPTQKEKKNSIKIT